MTENVDGVDIIHCHRCGAELNGEEAGWIRCAACGPVWLRVNGRLVQLVIHEGGPERLVKELAKSYTRHCRGTGLWDGEVED